jgi:hypothetical protein
MLEGKRQLSGMTEWKWIIIVYQLVHWIHLTQDKVQWRAMFGFPKGGKLWPAEFIRNGSQVVRQLLHYWCDIRRMIVLQQTAAVLGLKLIPTTLAIGPSFSSPLQSLRRSGGVTLMLACDVWQTPGARLSYRTAHESTNIEKDASLLWYDSLWHNVSVIQARTHFNWAADWYTPSAFLPSTGVI